MKKLFYTLFLIPVLAGTSYAQTLATPQNPDAIPLSEQDPYQQLIGYALEAAGAAFEEAKPLGKYKCTDVFSLDGYNALEDFPCEVIVHSDTGPIVVRYQNVDDDTSARITAFLTENQLTDNIRYNNGRFRFAFDVPTQEADAQASSEKPAP